MNPAPCLAIILLNWNSADDTLHSVEMISGWERLKPGIIVVDNNSPDDDLARLMEGGNRFRLVRNDANMGYAGGANAGISLALKEGYSFIMLLNSDAFIREDCLMHLLECLDRSPATGVVGPLVEEHGKIHAGGRNIGIYSNTRIPFAPAGNSPALNVVDYVPGTVLIGRREAFEKTGLLEEKYFFSGEIADFCTRLRSRGLQCAVYTGCVATHSTDTGSSVRETLYSYYTLRNRFLFVNRHFRYTRGLFILRWIAEGIARIMMARGAGRSEHVNALILGLRDGISGRFGDRNELFGR